MNILILGSGGREHALAWKLSQSHHCQQLFCAPGNPGTAQLGQNLPLSVTDFDGIAQACLDHRIEVLVVGPEEPLVKGIYDHFKSHPSLEHILVVGPSKAAAQLEGSKDFSKAFMQRHGIPTAAYASFTAENYAAGKAYVAAHPLPVVLKADGLAAGKGVVIAPTTEAALQTFEQMIQGRQFGAASDKVVVESFLSGVEVSVFVLTDGQDYQIIGHAKDYKRIGEGDQGPNTGGMGCVSPVPFAMGDFMEKTEARIIRPTIQGLAAEGLVYKGFLFFGLINVGGEPYVIEYNCRLGDPETEVVLPRLETDLLALLAAMDNGTLADANINYSPHCWATVVAVSGGYPGDYTKGKPIRLPQNMGGHPQSQVFHAGTAQSDAGLVTAGGRVLALTSWGESLSGAVKRSLALAGEIEFEGMAFRRDIGYEFP